MIFCTVPKQRLGLPCIHVVVEPHQPIPNLVVKHYKNDNTWGEALRNDSLMQGTKNSDSNSVTIPQTSSQTKFGTGTMFWYKYVFQKIGNEQGNEKLLNFCLQKEIVKKTFFAYH